MSFHSFGFEGVVDTLDYEKYLYSVICLPAEFAAQLPLAVHPRLRVEGEINDYPFSAAFIPSSQGHYLILGSARLKAMGLKVGMPVGKRTDSFPPHLCRCGAFHNAHYASNRQRSTIAQTFTSV